MSDMNSLAYPYANALFDLVKAENKIDDWYIFLNTLSLIAITGEFKSAISNPDLTQKQIVDFLLSCLNSEDIELKNFLSLLYSNKRLSILPEIFLLFEKIVESYKCVGKAVIESAFIIDDEAVKQIEGLLSKKFGKKIFASVKVNQGLIGGIKIIIDDVVIDASIRSSLDKMATQLMK
ncbi:MAG: F0F1 ATP synthase subunit delta [Proteobacteria bacterium]|jgi:F-type H+-transporting ATPase subunit delta|nr:F0F1 ATP synthase subunit delta [Pseudomonadota bacterium]